MRHAHEELIERARKWVRTYHCGLPVDLTAKLLEAGLDAGIIQEQLLQEIETDGNAR